MDYRSMPTKFPHEQASKFVRKSAFAGLALILAFATPALATAQTRVIITLPNKASAVERIAADELATHLHALYPSTRFETGAPAVGGRSSILELRRICRRVLPHR